MLIDVQTVDEPLKDGSVTRQRLLCELLAAPSSRRLGLKLGGADLAKQAAQEPDELHWLAVVAAVALRAPLGVFERRHRVEHDAQVVLARHLARSLADAEQLAKAGSPRAREELESGYEIPCP